VKITNLSLAAIAAVAMTTGAMADMDFKTTGQAVVYYQTMDGGDRDLFNQNGASANAGIQLNLNGEVEGLSIGLQGTAVSTLGLEGNLVDGVMQSGLGNSGDTANAGDYFSLTKAHFGKKIGNTTLKLGRQELPKSLSPFAFSEGWNVFKNTFDAAIAINSDIPDTTLVGAYVSRSNKHGDLSSFTYVNPTVDQRLDLDGDGIKETNLDNGVYMLTAQNKSIEGVTLTGSYYDAESFAKVAWLDAKVKMANLPVGLALQGGQVNPTGAGKTTTAYGAKLSGKAAGANLSLAYSTVDDGAVAIHNLGTGVKTPLYTQMVLNQWAIKKDADTFVLKGVVPAGAGKLIAQYGMTTANKTNILGDGNDYQELDVMYKFNLLGGKTFAGYIMRKTDDKTGKALMGGDDTNNVIRVWTRYNF
jgi:hypothetical protein